MGIFDSDPLDEQQEILGELLEEKQTELDELGGIDSPAASERRDQLNEQIKQIGAQIEQIKNQQQQQEQGLDQGGDLFTD